MYDEENRGSIPWFGLLGFTKEFYLLYINKLKPAWFLESLRLKSVNRFLKNFKLGTNSRKSSF